MCTPKSPSLFLLSIDSKKPTHITVLTEKLLTQTTLPLLFFSQESHGIKTLKKFCLRRNCTACAFKQRHHKDPRAHLTYL